MRVVFAEDLEYSLGARDLLEGVSLELYHGDRLALVGANGSGKTTLLRLLSGELEPVRGRVYKPEGIYLELLEQDPRFDPEDTVESVLKRGFVRLERLEVELERLEANLADPEVYHRWEELHERFEALGGYKRRSNYESVLKGLRFEGREGERVAVLSGGEARRLALGALLLSGADALLLDEPTNHLDLEMVDWLVGFLESYGGATITISHDRNFLDRVTRRVAWLRRGKLRLYEGNYSAFRAQRAAQEEQEAREYANWLKEKQRREGILEQARRWAPSSAKHARRMHSLEARMEQFLQEAPPELEGPDAAVRMHFPIESPGPERVLEATHLRKGFAGRKLFDIEKLLVSRGERIAVIGPNGAGKSTLVKVLLGQLPSDDPAGRIRTGPGVRVGYYDQKLSGFDPELTLFETLYRMLGEKAHAALGAWMFPYEAQFKQVGNLSGGERARLALLSLSLQQANLLVLDEPTNHLDLQTVEALEQALLAYEGTLLLISHDLFFLDRLATRTWHLRGGQFDDYPAPPGEYLERRKVMVLPELARPAEPPAPKPQPRREKSRWHLERERERLEATITELEAQLRALHAEANQTGLSPQDYARIAAQEAEIHQQLEALYARWGELADV
ncbi:ribosomal protection-like ABC-F family protein [Calidithermus roseus]|uniref:Energy-dependent translational throttle protein EttA n=1 Tax=Calidithermus roseus TaxID=1644118 RepID=A0A399EQ32_9DEIN|nr:ABC-F family ATP-binding cassette domain-containing protein [Calidithermus roseus]RIH85656.1 Energy-dependent translational throttle protein EttA [Calidithermus roseus]